MINRLIAYDKIGLQVIDKLMTSASVFYVVFFTYVCNYVCLVCINNMYLLVLAYLKVDLLK